MITVQCKNIVKTYGEGSALVHALNGIDLTAHSGELLILAGPSGCGKTTLLSIISGVLTQDSGECLVLGEGINNLQNDVKTAFRGKNIGFVFQAFNLIPMLTAKENVTIPLILQEVEENSALRLATDLLSRVGLEERVDAYPLQLSGGEQQRVAIVRSCIHNPKIIVSDEPTSALDQSTGRKVMELFKEIAIREDTTIIIVTHDERIFSFADRILKMEDGKIIETI